MAVTVAADSLGIGAFDLDSGLELRSPWTEDDLQAVIRSVYRQVLGNDHLMQSERLVSSESLLRQGNITVREFVRSVAKSELYRGKFFHSNPQNRLIELNYKHLLGRAPYDESEIAFHTDLYIKEGYDAEIDSYIDSQEYLEAFGENIVPYYRGFASQLGQKTVGFNRMFRLYRGYANSDRSQFGSNKARLTREVAQNATNAILFPTAATKATANPTAKLAGVSAGDSGRIYLIQVSNGSTKANRTQIRLDHVSYLVPYNQLSTKLQQIGKSGDKILSVTIAK
ncbi:Phycobilisome Linker polypeptide/CpcD/allophycocyanin linker domain protein [Synechococcus sp. PCC 7502]|uniref:phycobilisome linker polypeptide n=1 Tax=Synechococcus sp. PCC 7502 TaxID=1173263 RepID=UPI00029F98F3|nr:phycobilisome linker polypeptide [Synechococcus sp. PCC 7502]AFY75162.1 Phycobilisome Linker polypeptide/CpcD/allophycocyanin linker domain protein [Synechococcus sp. PCC 7502]